MTDQQISVAPDEAPLYDNDGPFRTDELRTMMECVSIAIGQLGAGCYRTHVANVLAKVTTHYLRSKAPQNAEAPAPKGGQ